MIVLIALRALVASLVFVQSAPAPGNVSQAEIRQRLTTYEQQVDRGRPDAQELVAIAGLVIRAVQDSAVPAAQIEACASDVMAAEPDCDQRLWRIARNPSARFEHRAAAASALARRKDQQAPQFLLDLVKAASVDQLTAAASALGALPQDRAVPVLERMLKSSSPAAHAAACRVLGGINRGESQIAIASYLNSAPRGTQPYYACTLAAARVGDAMALRVVSGIVNYLTDFDLIEAAEIVGTTDPERAADLLMLATRQSAPLARLAAAERLAGSHPEIAVRVMTPALDSDRAELRAAALTVHRKLALEATRHIRTRLVDTDPLVRLRAAETIISRARHERAIGNVLPAGRRH